MEQLQQVMHTLTPEQLEHVYFYILDEVLGIDDNAYLASIPGMMESIKEGINTPLSECVPLREVWPDV
jgi:hypothetical protein